MGGIVLEKVNVQLLLTQEEYESLKKNADKQGLTVPCYIKSVVLEDDYFYGFYKKLLDKVEQLPSGTKFNIKALFGVEWTMPKGIKLTLGRTYFNRVDKGIIDNVIATGKDSSNVMWYERK
ncbi:MAG: single-stranded DNA-binding protein [Paenibacillaceae bacterium]|nr:single-stranded DNA-binding protein [Paenibacillaceae bacterium]